MRLLFKNNKIRYTLIADIISVFGDYLFLIALLTYASTLVDSELAISIYSFLFTLPLILSSFPAILADKTKNTVKALLCTNTVNLFIFVCIGIILTCETSIVEVIKYNFRVVDANFTIFMFLLVLLFIVQLISSYENGVATRLFVKIVDKDDMEEARGLMTGSIVSIKIIAKFLASILLAIMTYADIAYINAMTYLIVIGIYVFFSLKNRAFILKLNTDMAKQVEEQKTKEKGLSLYSRFKIIFKELAENKVIGYIINTGIILNMVSGSIKALLLIFLTKNTEYQIINFQTSLSIVLINSSAAGIIGSLFIVPFTKKHKISYYIFGSFLLSILIYFVIILMNSGYSVSNFSTLSLNIFSWTELQINSKNIIFIAFLIIYFVIELTSTIMSAKFSVYVLKTINPNTLATSSSVLFTIMTSFIPLGSFLILFLTNNYAMDYGAYFAIVVLVVGLMMVLKEKFHI